jgi:NADH-quinone oxidoreductase subunit B
LFYALLKLQEKIDNTPHLVRKPTYVRLEQTMLDDFKKRIMVSQVAEPAPEEFVTLR